jgi:excisionase family DNA binding protein
METSASAFVSGQHPAGTAAWMTLHEAGRALGVHVNTLRRWADAQAIRSYRTIGGHRRLSADDVYAMARRSSPTPASADTGTPIDSQADSIIDSAIRGDLTVSEARLRLRSTGHAQGTTARRAGESAAATITSHLPIRQAIRERVTRARIAAGIARSEIDEREWSDPLADAFLLGLAEATGSVPGRFRSHDQRGGAAVSNRRRGPPQ